MAIIACLVVLVPPARATTVVPPEFPTLVNESDYIVHAITRSVTSEKRVGPRGAKIFTRVELEIVEVIAGNAPAQLTLEFLGGRVGAEQMTVGGMPQFRVGDEDILFVRGNGRSICPLYAMMHGRYLVDQDTAAGRKFIARADGSPLQNTGQVAAMLEHEPGSSMRSRAAMATALHPADFIRQIKATVQPGARVSREK